MWEYATLPTVTNPDKLLTPGQAAALIGVSAESIRRYAEAGTLPHTLTPGGHRRYRRSDVLALVTPTEVAS